MKCKICGCTDNRACPGGCYWAQRNLCSRCVKQAMRDTLLLSLAVSLAIALVAIAILLIGFHNSRCIITFLASGVNNTYSGAVLSNFNRCLIGRWIP